MSTFNFRNLPISAKRNLGIGVFFALLLALPLAVWSILNLNLNTREKAAVVNFPSYSVCGDTCDPQNPCKGSNGQLTCVGSLGTNTGQCRNNRCPDKPDCICPNLPNLQVTEATLNKLSSYENVMCPGYLLTVKVGNTGSVNANVLNSKLEISFNPGQRKFASNCIGASVLTNFSSFLSSMTSNSLLGIRAEKTQYIYINPNYSGNVAVTVKIDTNNVVTETDESDNTFTKTFSVTNTGPTRTPTVTPTITSTPTVTPTSNPTVTPTSTALATVTPTSTATGAPNYCGGTCGSNFNCQANYYCYQGFCRNPVCPSDSNCDCIANATPTVTPTFRSKTATPKVTATSTATSYSFSGTKTTTPKSTSKATATGNTNMNNNPENKFFVKYALPLFGVFAAIVLFTIVYALKKSSTKDTSIDRISPPTNI